MPWRARAVGAWVSILGVALLIILFFATYRVVQIQKHLQAVQAEAAQASDQVADLKKETASLKSELDQAQAQANTLQAKLD